MPLDSSGRFSHFSALTRRIIFFNAVALVILIGGVLLVQTSGRSLIDERISGIRQQALIVAGTLAEYTTDPDTHRLKDEDAESLLRQLIAPTKLRARLYDTSGHLVTDTRELLPRNVVQVSELPPLDFWSRVDETWKRIFDGVMGIRPFAKLQPYFEAGNDGRVYAEVNAALSGETESAERVDERNRLVLSVAAPIQRFKAIYGVLMVSTEGGDIDDILREERLTLIEVFAVALIVMLLSSLYLAGFIAEPIRRLADAADRVRSGRAGRDSIPRFRERTDEIGDLAESFSAMTRALYDRIDAIESFAADVAHELKNPLTSLRSAVEIFSRARDDTDREKLVEVVRNDVRRIDRLISDISDASRLDAELNRETPGPVDLARLLETIIEVYKFMQLPRGVTLSLASDLPADTMVFARDERLGQVFRNLIDNAVSFSPDGAIVSITARKEGSLAIIAVADEGPGIPPDNLESVFGRFYTERPAEHGFGKNSGLGLSIARQIVNGVNGRIWAENREAGGARFVVELPVARATQVKQIALSPIWGGEGWVRGRRRTQCLKRIASVYEPQGHGSRLAHPLTLPSPPEGERENYFYFPMTRINIHASCVMLAEASKPFGTPEEAGILILGPSGSGKSDLALRLIERGAKLVSDDRTDIFVENSVLFARAPAALAGLMEVRGVGIVALPFVQQARIALAVELTNIVPRLPQPEKFRPPSEIALAENACPPLIRLSPFEASAPAKVVLAAAANAKALFRENRNPI